MSRQQRPFGSHVHTFNYFVMSCPNLRSFSFLELELSFQNPEFKILDSQNPKY